MSVLLQNADGYIVSHENIIESVYKNVNIHNNFQDFNFNEYFNLVTPFTRSNKSVEPSVKKKRKRIMYTDEVLIVERKFNSIMKLTDEQEIFTKHINKSIDHCANNFSRLSAHKCFETMKDIGSVSGGNTNDHPIVTTVCGNDYLFPPNCIFINDDINTIHKHISKSYDFVLLDPPWYNRFVKRRRKYHPEHGYQFLDENELSKIPVKDLLVDGGLVAVWTTNSQAHIETVKQCLFPSWGVTYISTWFWIKVTKHGELIVPLSNIGNKQPYERIMFGCKPGRKLPTPDDNKCIISQPSSVHSHKPPLTEVLKDFIPEDGKCLELFARYLLPGWTSMGNQVLSLQLKSLYSSKQV